MVINRLIFLATRHPFSFWLLGLCFFATCTVGCQTHEQTADDAFERVKEEKSRFGDTAIPVAVVAPRKAAPATNPKPALDKWSQFKQTTDAKIAENIATINMVKSLPNKGRTLKTVVALEKENNELSARLIAYELEEKARREDFETQLNADLATVTENLKELKTSTEK